MRIGREEGGVGSRGLGSVRTSFKYIAHVTKQIHSGRGRGVGVGSLPPKGKELRGESYYGVKLPYLTAI